MVFNFKFDTNNLNVLKKSGSSALLVACSQVASELELSLTDVLSEVPVDSVSFVINGHEVIIDIDNN